MILISESGKGAVQTKWVTNAGTFITHMSIRIVYCDTG